MTTPPTTAEVLTILREDSASPGLFHGFGPLVVAAILALALALLVPSVAPERLIDRPADSTDQSTDAVEPAP